MRIGGTGQSGLLHNFIQPYHRDFPSLQQHGQDERRGGIREMRSARRTYGEDEVQFLSIFILKGELGETRLSVSS